MESPDEPAFLRRQRGHVEPACGKGADGLRSLERELPYYRGEQLAGRALAVVEGLGMGERRRRKVSMPYANI
jgi:hypothetical protein